MTWSTCIIDPPWPEHGGGQSKRGADRHYPLVLVDQMFAVVSLSPAWTPAENAHLYAWVTDTYLPAGLRLMADLEFRYVRTFCWVKLLGGVDVDRVTDETLDESLATGLGQYARGQHELCLFGVRGDGMAVRTERRDIGSVIPAQRAAHSAKPACFYDLVEARNRGPYQEIFARSARPGWLSWGNEV